MRTGKCFAYCPRVTAFIVVYKDVRKILGGFFDSNYKYGCVMLTKMINIDLKS